jgi:hypothetical protein
MELDLCSNTALDLLGDGELCSVVQLSLLWQRVHIPLLLGPQFLLLGGHVGQQVDGLAGLEAAVEGTDDGVRVIDGDGPDVSELLDLHGALLELGIRHLDVELSSSRFDSVPSSQSRGEVHVSRHAEVGRVDNLIRGWVVEDSLGVDTGLVGEGAETSDGGVALSC